MNLSELIRYRNQLEALNALHALTLADTELNKIDVATQICPVDIADQLAEFNQHRDEIFKNFQNLESALDQIKLKINNAIDTLGQEWFQESEQRYEHELRQKTPEQILDRSTSIPQVDFDFFTSRLSTYAAWKYPGMILRPAKNSMIHGMVCFDPLYIVDVHADLLWPCQLTFPDQYRRRLRPIVIDESESTVLDSVPDNQFGIVLAYDYFNFLPMSIVVSMLQQIFNKLRPGGTLCMTFNDCDTEPGMKLVEAHRYATYIPRRKLIEHINRIGYQHIQFYNNASPLTWLELRKPGNLTSIRGGQVLAQVRPKPQQT